MKVNGITEERSETLISIVEAQVCRWAYGAKLWSTSYLSCGTYLVSRPSWRARGCRSVLPVRLSVQIAALLSCFTCRLDVEQLTSQLLYWSVSTLNVRKRLREWSLHLSTSELRTPRTEHCSVVVGIFPIRNCVPHSTESVTHGQRDARPTATLPAAEHRRRFGQQVTTMIASPTS